MKLVRDKIPEIIRQNGENPVTHVASETEFKQALSEKLLEEANEFRANPCAEELEDVLEVVESLKQFHATVDDVKLKKSIEKGAFSKKIILH